jgi:hypothetical protein
MIGRGEGVRAACDSYDEASCAAVRKVTCFAADCACMAADAYACAPVCVCRRCHQSWTAAAKAQPTHLLLCLATGRSTHSSSSWLSLSRQTSVVSWGLCSRYAGLTDARELADVIWCSYFGWNVPC